MFADRLVSGDYCRLEPIVSAKSRIGHPVAGEREAGEATADVQLAQALSRSFRQALEVDASRLPPASRSRFEKSGIAS